ncbi:MAG: hypothetical protein GF383_12340 [Candidatus Lokiarchaeota archaeon]|nr:hypothetical protein [Candidatus Lokiarchaeota archaeon]MBD3341789.1 hypothetical protein [Candidatus Lokiarchaeota archaeon]
MIIYIGGLISNELNISPPAGRGLIKLAIKDEFGPFINYGDISFENFMKVINNSLKLRFKQLNISNPSKIIEYLREKLVNSQSLLTLGAI